MKFLLWLVALLILGPLAWAMFGVLRESLIKGWKDGWRDDPIDKSSTDDTHAASEPGATQHLGPS